MSIGPQDLIKNPTEVLGSAVGDIAAPIRDQLPERLAPLYDLAGHELQDVAAEYLAKAVGEKALAQAGMAVDFITNPVAATPKLANRLLAGALPPPARLILGNDPLGVLSNPGALLEDPGKLAKHLANNALNDALPSAARLLLGPSPLDTLANNPLEAIQNRIQGFQDKLQAQWDKLQEWLKSSNDPTELDPEEVEPAKAVAVLAVGSKLEEAVEKQAGPAAPLVKAVLEKTAPNAKAKPADQVCLPCKGKAIESKVEEPKPKKPPATQPTKPPPLTKKKYNVEVTVSSRAGDIPIPGVQAQLNDNAIGTTDHQGHTLCSTLRTDPVLELKVIYVNEGENLKKEDFTLRVENINADAGTYKAGKAKNKIAKIQDVLGTGSNALKGDKDFEDEYDLPGDQIKMIDSGTNEKTLKIAVKLATLSLNVDYSSQRAGGSETIQYEDTKSGRTKNSKEFKGSQICMPTSTLMLLNYWNIKQPNGSPWNRSDVMQHCWDHRPKNKRSLKDGITPWQNWENVRSAAQATINGDPNTSTHLKSQGTLPGFSIPASNQGVPSPFADEIAKRLAMGEPSITSTWATNGHVMLIRGAVVDHKNQVHWLIFNDPNGTLASPDSVYGELNLSAPVGLRGDYTMGKEMNNPGDVEAIQAALKSIGLYSGPINGKCSESNETDPTVQAIRKFQRSRNADGRIDPGGNSQRKLNAMLQAKDKAKYGYDRNENEINTSKGANSERGKHVYYNGETEGRGARIDPTNKNSPRTKKFDLKGRGFFIIITRKPQFAKEEISARLSPGG